MKQSHPRRTGTTPPGSDRVMSDHAQPCQPKMVRAPSIDSIQPVAVSPASVGVWLSVKPIKQRKSSERHISSDAEISKALEVKSQPFLLTFVITFSFLGDEKDVGGPSFG